MVANMCGSAHWILPQGIDFGYASNGVSGHVYSRFGSSVVFDTGAWRFVRDWVIADVGVGLISGRGDSEVGAGSRFRGDRLEQRTPNPWFQVHRLTGWISQYGI